MIRDKDHPMNLCLQIGPIALPDTNSLENWTKINYTLYRWSLDTNVTYHLIASIFKMIKLADMAGNLLMTN